MLDDLADRVRPVAVPAAFRLAHPQDHIVAVAAELGDGLLGFGRVSHERYPERVDAVARPAVQANAALKLDLLALLVCKPGLCPLAIPPVLHAAGDLRQRDDGDEQRGEAGEHGPDVAPVPLHPVSMARRSVDRQAGADRAAGVSSGRQAPAGHMLRRMTLVGAGGPSWTDILTAIGTVGAVIVALGIALYTDRRADKRIKAERQLAREREQLAEAYAVQVAAAERSVGDGPPNQFGALTDSGVRQLAVMVVNRGSFTIIRLEAKFLRDGSLSAPHAELQVPGLETVPLALRQGWRLSLWQSPPGVLAPWDEGIRYDSDNFDAGRVNFARAIVRWTDRWGTRWEHDRGVVRQVTDDTPWGS